MATGGGCFKMQIALSVKNISKEFADFSAVNDVTFDVEDGKFFSILGPSCCGKTTLLRMIAGFYEPSGGFLTKLGILQQPIEMLYNDITMIMGLVYTTMLFMVIPIIGVMESLDDSLIEAAHDLGAKKLTIWRKIIIPWAMPGIMCGSVIVFMLVLGSYLTPKLMGGKNSLWFTEQIYNQMIIYFNWNQGAAFGFLLLLLSSLIIMVALKLTKQEFSKIIK